MEIDKEELQYMMMENWALENNEDCHLATVQFCDKWGINLDEINMRREYI